jgi:mRNA-degrading endonuclease RelE of RelBE toxin-antitoxin system
VSSCPGNPLLCTPFAATLLSIAPSTGFHSPSLRCAPALLVKRSLSWNPAKATLPSVCSKESLRSSDAACPSCSNSKSSVGRQAKRRYCAGPRRRLPNSPTHAVSSLRSTKPTKFDTAQQAGQDAWQVHLHPAVKKLATEIGLDSPRFSPTLLKLIETLEANPKQFPKKKGKLQHVRAARLKFEGVIYRAVFVLDEMAHKVLVVAIDPHDLAYKKASRRL